MIVLKKIHHFSYVHRKSQSLEFDFCKLYSIYRDHLVANKEWSTRVTWIYSNVSLNKQDWWATWIKITWKSTNAT